MLKTKGAKVTLAGLLLVGSSLAGAQMMMDYPYGYYQEPSQIENQAQPSSNYRDGFMYDYGYMGPGMMRGWHRHLSWEDRQALLRGKMDLSDNQKQAWEGYVNALENMVPAKSNATQQTNGDTEALLNARIQDLKARISALENVQKARQTLINTLTPEQLKVLQDYEEGK